MQSKPRKCSFVVLVLNFYLCRMFFCHNILISSSQFSSQFSIDGLRDCDQLILDYLQKPGSRLVTHYNSISNLYCKVQFLYVCFWLVLPQVHELFFILILILIELVEYPISRVGSAIQLKCNMLRVGKLCTSLMRLCCNLQQPVLVSNDNCLRSLCSFLRKPYVYLGGTLLKIEHLLLFTVNGKGEYIYLKFHNSSKCLKRR